MSKTNKYDDRVARLYQSGMTIPAVAKTVKISKTSVMDALKRKGVETRRRGPPTLLGDAEARHLALSGLTVNEIAKQLKCSRQTVYNHLKATGTHPGSRPKPTDAEITDLYKNGSTDADIAQLTGLHPGSVFLIRKRLGIKGHTRAILTPSDVERMLSLAIEGWRQVDIAKELGIAQNTVSHYLIKHGVRRYPQRTRKAKQ